MGLSLFLFFSLQARGRGRDEERWRELQNKRRTKEHSQSKKRERERGEERARAKRRTFTRVAPSPLFPLFPPPSLCATATHVRLGRACCRQRRSARACATLQRCCDCRPLKSASRLNRESERETEVTSPPAADSTALSLPQFSLFVVSRAPSRCVAASSHVYARLVCLASSVSLPLSECVWRETNVTSPGLMK